MIVSKNCTSRKLTNKSFEAKVGAVRAYFIANEIDIPRNFWKLNAICSDPKTRDRLPGREELQAIFTHMDAKGRAFYMMQLSSGLRIGDLLEVTMPYSYKLQFAFIHWLLECFPNAFPLLRYRVGFNHYL
jgi:hypothetical protein